jgi:hypothetical protein
MKNKQGWNTLPILKLTICFKEGKSKNNSLTSLHKRSKLSLSCIMSVKLEYIPLDTRLGAELAILHKKLGIDSENILKEL